jgi:hypothetical protein
MAQTTAMLVGNLDNLVLVLGVTPCGKCIIQMVSIIKILRSLNTTIYFDVNKKEKQLHVSARGHRQVGSFGFARKNAF